MSRYVREKPLSALWIAIGVVIVGRLIDLQWHLTHDEFEGASEQIRAHLVVWIGVLLVLALTAVAIREGIRSAGFRLTLAGAVLYVPVATWHFIEHANGTDPELPHVLLAIAQVAIIAGALMATIGHWRQGPLEAAGLRE